jgi:hypothetical protein
VRGAISDGRPYRDSHAPRTNFQRLGPEVGFEEIAIDFLQVRFWITFEFRQLAHKLQTYNIAWCCEAQKVPIGATVAGDYYCLGTRSRGRPKENG